MAPDRLRQILQRSRADVFDPERVGHVRAIVEDVQRRGDDAIVEHTRRYDGVELSAARIQVDRDEVRRAYDAVGDGLRAALAGSIDRVRRYNEWLRPAALQLEEIES